MIARIERVALRDVWQHEAYDFTQWLEDNIDVLSEAIGRTILNPEREKKTESTFSVDLVAEGEDGSPIIIENQLEKSNHDHLGKVITYLTAMQASTAVWIVSEPRPEHVAALAWLNEATNADFYLLKIEAIKIETSPPAPLLTLIVGPSEEAKSIGRSKQEMSERDRIRHKWWSQLLQHPDARLHKHISPGKQSWIGVASGYRGIAFNYAMTRQGARVEAYIDRGKGLENQNLQIFEQFLSKKANIETAFGGELVWQRLEGKRAFRIHATIPGGYNEPEEKWPQVYDQMTNTMNRLVHAIRPEIKQLKVDEQPATEDDSAAGAVS